MDQSKLLGKAGKGEISFNVYIQPTVSTERSRLWELFVVRSLLCYIHPLVSPLKHLVLSEGR